MFKAEFHKIRWYLASRIRIRSYIWLFARIRIRIIPSTSKKIKKILDVTVLWLHNNLLFLKTDVNVHSVSDKQRNLTKIYFCIILKATEEKSRIRIRNQVVWIRGSGSVLKKLQPTGTLRVRNTGLEDKSGTDSPLFYFWVSCVLYISCLEQ